MEKSPVTEYRYSILRISGKYFGVEVKNVREVLLLPIITHVPNVHKSVMGVFNLRGHIQSVIDISNFLNLPERKISEEDFVVIVELEGITLGILVEKVLDVMAVDANKIQIPTRDMPLSLINYCSGFCSHKKLGDVFLLDLEMLFKAKEIRGYSFVLGV